MNNKNSHTKFAVTIVIAFTMFTGLTATASYQSSYAFLDGFNCIIYCPESLNDCGTGEGSTLQDQDVRNSTAEAKVKCHNGY